MRRWNSASERRNCLIFVLVGLPARGKSYISKKILNYLTWKGVRAKLYNVGNKRRQVCEGVQSADFFSQTNADAAKARENLAFDVFGELLGWLAHGGEVALFDATNTTRERRAAIVQHVQASGVRANLIFLESICDDKAVLQSNFDQKISNSPDYVTMPREAAIADLQQRIANYERVYETVSDDENISYVKLINLQSKVICNNIRGNLAHVVVAYLMSIHVIPRPIWLVRAGSDRLARRSSLGEKPRSHSRDEQDTAFKPQDYVSMVGKRHSSEGPTELVTQKFSGCLAAFVEERIGELVPGGVNDLLVYSSLLPRAMDAIADLPVQQIQIEYWSALNPLNAGDCQGLSMEEIKTKRPDVHESWSRDPFNFRMPGGGESYRDLVLRLDPLISEMERIDTGMLIVSHLSTLQVLYGYFIGCPADKCPTLDIPAHTVIEMVPNQYGWKETRFPLERDPAIPTAENALRVRKASLCAPVLGAMLAQAKLAVASGTSGALSDSISESDEGTDDSKDVKGTDTASASRADRPLGLLELVDEDAEDEFLAQS
eukprot:Opistho-2@2927